MSTNRIHSNTGRLIAYIESRIILRNLVLAFLIVIFGTVIIMQILKIYTHHNQEFAVPDLTGLTLRDAARAARESDMFVEVFDSVYVADFERGTVVEQHPKAGRKVKKNRKLFLTMNAINPEKVAMPDLVDLTFKQAAARLESFGLKAGFISYEPNIAINVVLAQRIHGHAIAPGDSVNKGSAVDLVLGKGLSNEQASVPSLIGMSLEQAKMAASDRFLSVGAAVHDQTVVNTADELKAIIYRQKPMPGSGMLPLGSPIDVWITLDSTRVPGNNPSDTTLVNP